MKKLFYSYGFCEVARHVHVFPFVYSYVIAKQLQRNRCNERSETFGNLWHFEQVVGEITYHGVSLSDDGYD